MKTANFIKTVNVLECTDDGPLGIHSFIDDKQGNQEAEKFFREVALENGAKEDELDDCLDDGHFESGNYYLYIIHSTN
jgi:hypothetical protein